MSRRVPNPAAERAAQNLQTIKTLLKLEGNKTCADCKRNKHPRWASWNLGIFVCIRCSGIHRGMGTHISRVKSVDLDAWTDEQLQSVLQWGNTRANKYWEAKLAPGHVPSEAKIENFIRTKYESKRWTMEGPIPNPATLDDEGDDDIPLNVVQEKAKLERSASQQKPSSSKQQNADIFGEIQSPPPRPSTTEVQAARPPPSALKASGPPAQPKPADSLLGLDFFGGAPSAPSGGPSGLPSSRSTSAAASRPDLKQSILSLYASAPKPQPRAQHERQASFGGMQSPPAQVAPTKSSFEDAFSGLSFTSTASSAPPKPQQQQQPKPKPNAFTAFDKPANQRSAVVSPQLTSSSVGGGGGSFFDTSSQSAKSTSASKPNYQNPPPQKVDLGFGELDLNSSKSTNSTKPAASSTFAAAGSKLTSLFDFSGSYAKNLKPEPKPSTASSDINSAFDLSAKPPASSQPTSKPAAPPASSSAFSGFSTADAWGSNNAWATPDPSASTKAEPPKTTSFPTIPTGNADLGGWGGSSTTTSGFSGSSGAGGFQAAPTPRVTADEDFGGWNSAAVPTSAPAAAAPPRASTTSAVSKTSEPSVPLGAKPPAFSTSEDLFSNVWE
ncbi:hypothetical protein MMC31_006717 [Peltigera leucophlebia]|nr:hypothetical protein [Peltigera leucophlebia]